MNTTNNILAMLSTGAAGAPMAPTNGLDSQGLLGFLNALVQQLQGTAAAGTSPLAAQTAEADLKFLSEKISALLQQQGVAPEIAQTKLSELMATLTPQNIAGTQPGFIQASLTSDLAAPFSAQILNAENKTPADPVFIKEVTALLEKIAPGRAANDEDIAKLVDLMKSHMPAEQTTAAIPVSLPEQPQPLPQAVLPAELKEKVDALKLALAAGDREAIHKAKAELIQLIKDSKDSGKPAINENAGHTMAALTQALHDQQPEREAPPVMAAAPAPRIPAMPHTSVPSAKDLMPAKTEQVQSLTDTEKTTATETKDRAPAPMPKTAADHNLPQAPAPQQPANVSAKVAGINVNAAMIQELTNNAAGFDANGDGTQRQAQQGSLSANGELLRSVSPDALKTQNFTNYMNAAHNMPSPTTQMVHVQLMRNISSKIDRMTIQLDPVDLGRMDIRLEFSKEGAIKAHMTVDKPETLALLQRDAHFLEKTLQQAGIDADENSLSFDLRQNQQNLEGFDGRNRQGYAGEFAGPVDGAADNVLQAKIAVQAAGYISQSGINIMV